jgi:hypothetical protein
MSFMPFGKDMYSFRCHFEVTVPKSSLGDNLAGSGLRPGWNAVSGEYLLEGW